MRPSTDDTVGDRPQDLDRLRISDAQAQAMEAQRRGRVHAKGHGGLFLKGPVPWPWLAAAARLPGRALHVGIVVWLLVGLQRKRRVALRGQLLAEAGIQRHAAYRGLRHLEDAGLVAVTRHAGRAPVVLVRDLTGAGAAPDYDNSSAGGAP